MSINPRALSPMKVSDRIADWYFDHGYGSYGDCYAQVAWEIKQRAKRWHKIRSGR